MKAMTTFAHSYADALSQPWSVEYIGSFLTARDLAEFSSTCGVLSNSCGDYVRAILKAQHGHEQHEDLCIATMKYLKCLENIPRVCAISGLDSMSNSWILRVPLRRGHYYLFAYGCSYRFQNALDLFFNFKRIMPDTLGRFPDIIVKASGFQCLICLPRPYDADAEAEHSERSCVRLTRICFVPI